MPRRNRNANGRAIDPDELDTQTRHLETDLSQSDRIKNAPDWAGSRQADVNAVPPLCTACRANPATDGDYCTLCKGQIIVSARKNTLGRR